MCTVKSVCIGSRDEVLTLRLAPGKVMDIIFRMLEHVQHAHVQSSNTPRCTHGRVVVKGIAHNLHVVRMV